MIQNFIDNPNPHKFVMELDETSEKIHISLRKKRSGSASKKISHIEKIIRVVTAKLQTAPSDPFYRACGKWLINKHAKNVKLKKKITDLSKIIHRKESLISKVIDKQEEPDSQVEKGSSGVEILSEEEKIASKEQKRAKEAEDEFIASKKPPSALFDGDHLAESIMNGSVAEPENEEERFFDKVQKQVIKNDIVKAVSLLEEYAKEKGRDLREEEICRGFDLIDNVFKIGKWKGIVPIGDYNEQILITEKEGEDGIHRVVEQIKDASLQCSKNFLFFSKEKQIFYVLRQNEKGQIEIYQRDANAWIECKDEDLLKLNLKSTDLCIGLAKPFSNPETQWRHQEETRSDTRSPKGYFYQEFQESNESLCAIHASNAFFGYQALDIVGYYHFFRKFVKKKCNISTAEYELESTSTDTRKGTDPYILTYYLRQFAKRNKSLEKYAGVKGYLLKESGIWDEEEMSKIPPSCDRAIICYRGAHAAAIRKDSLSQKWYFVDSLEENSQREAYDTLKSAIKSKDVLYTTMIVIY